MSLEEITYILDSTISKDGNVSIEQIYNLLNRYEPNKIIYCLKSRFPDIQLEYVQPIINEPNYKEKIERDDTEFRAIVKSRFINCIICEPTKCHPVCCEVAHIWNFADCDASSAYNPDNGLLMCANWHRLFDNHLLQLEPVNNCLGMVRIRLETELLDTALGQYHNKIISIMPENIPFLYKRIPRHSD
jgi:hypothetical protein